MDTHWLYRMKGSSSYRVVLPRKVAEDLGISRWYGTFPTEEEAAAARDAVEASAPEGAAEPNKYSRYGKAKDKPKTKAKSKKASKIETPTITDEPLEEYDGPVHRILTASNDIKSVQELLDYFSIDTDEWEVVDPLVNKWPTTMKGPDGNPLIVNNFQIKVKLKSRVGGVDLQALADKIAERMPSAPVTKPFVIPEDPHALEINIPDLHYGQLCWSPESGSNYDSSLAATRFMAAIHRLLGLASAFNIEQIYFPIGSDFFNTDTITDTTTAGTPQHNDGRWQKMYQEGVCLLIEAVDLLRQHAPVEVVLVQGNHDYERSYCGALHLDAYFREDPNVNVNWQPIERKYYTYGSNLMVHSHGHGPKKKDWLGVVASEEPELWGRTKFREVHLGHYHHLETEEKHGLVVRYLGSLAATDAWHYSKGYVGTRKSAHAYIYHPEEGPIVNTTYHVVC